MTDSNGGLHATVTLFFPFNSPDLESMQRAKNIFKDVLDFVKERGGVECGVEYHNDRLWLKAEAEQPVAVTASLDAVIVRASDEGFPAPIDVAEFTDIPAAWRRSAGDTP